MATHHNITWGSAAVCLCLFAAPVPAWAQPGGAPQGNQGPMRVERVETGFAIAPEFKITEVDGKQARLAGAYGGWVLDRTLLIGGGAYWLANRSSAFKMAYGGAVVEWLMGADEPVGFSARGLFGAGSATLPATAHGFAGPLDHDYDGHMIPVDPRLVPVNVRVHEHFFVAEPQANVLVRLTDRLQLTAGVGYRLIGGTYTMNRQLRGTTGSIGVQLGTARRRRSP
jgi:hypothetical protein